MKYRKIVYGLLVSLIVIGVIGLVVIYNIYNNQISIAFLDIGQGDSILISKGSQQILIDGGPDGVVLMERLGEIMPFWDRNIEVVIATHLDGDHVGGLISVFENYSVNQFWYTSAINKTSISKKLTTAVDNEDNLEKLIAYNGLNARIEDAELHVVYPFNSESVKNIEDINDSSIAIVLTINDETFYLGGDLSSEIEDVLPIKENITVLKAGHHGSGSSTSESFLEKTNPRDVIISAGLKNRYGHPHKDVIDRIQNIGAKIFRTYEVGNIIYVCDKEMCKMRL